MLVRAAKRKAQYEALAKIRLQPGPLLLPWLCPVQLHSRRPYRLSSTSSASTTSRPPSRPTLSSTETSAPTLRRRHSQSRRRLATAAAEVRAIPEDYVPFDTDANTTYRHEPSPDRSLGWSSSQTSSSYLKDFDPVTSPIIINNSLAVPPRRFIGRGGSDSGTTADLHLTFETCLRVGWLDRAASIVRRLGTIYAPGVPELLQAHNAYLRVLVTRVLTTRDEAAFRRGQQWFEVEMKNKEVSGDATTFALLIKGSLQLLQAPKLERTVRRYMELATRAGDDVELLNLPILSDTELYHVTQMCPSEFATVSDERLTLELSADSGKPAEHVFQPGPEVNPMHQKGLGLKTVKQSIAMLAKSAITSEATTSDLTTDEASRRLAINRQESLEKDVIASTVDRWKQEASMDKGLWKVKDRARKGQLGVRSWEWYQGLQTSLREEMRLIEEAVAAISNDSPRSKSVATRERTIYGPFLKTVAVERLAALTVLTCLSHLCDRHADRGVRLATLALHLGQAVEDESEVIATQDLMRTMGGDRKIQMLKDATEVQSARWSLKKLAKRQGKTVRSKGVATSAPKQIDMPHTPWTVPIKAKVGSVLVARLMSTAMIPVSRTHPETGRVHTNLQPAFSHSFLHNQGKKVGVLVGNPAVINELKLAPLYIGMVKSLPMVAEPIKWSGFRQGGYYGYRQPVMRVRDTDSSQREHVEVAAERGDMDQIWEGLNVLSKTPWTINHAVFKVMSEAWNSGEAIANLPPEHPDLKDPPEPSATSSDAERRRWMRAMVMVQNERSGLQSQRCSQNLQLEIARAFYNETFYFPHNLDFRGRAYPIPPHFNHMGADHCRGLLLFAEGKELGPTGLRWLKIHLANVFGFDKASFLERERFAMEHLSQIYEVATSPLQGTRWWLTAEDPWQFLAASIELKAALDSPDPTRYVSRLPVHSDGTCNGLQHYAALGGDMEGARQVNLEPGDRPSDVYTGVADLVRQEIAADALAGNTTAQLLDGRVTRKVVKQTVMTNVYGVTFIGAAAQVRTRLAETIPLSDLEAANLDLGIVSRYVAQKIFRSLGSLFRGAHEIQYWLTECASRICCALTPEQMERLEESESAASGTRRPSTVVNEAKFLQPKRRVEIDHSQFKLPVAWTTPLKMPIVQPYRASRTTRIVTAIQGMSINQPSAASRVDKRKQLQGFPPNFIHSLDATHMFLSALQSHEQGITFAAVHDSFWTHARDTDRLAYVLRDAFIRMHSEDIIGRLAAEFRTRYAGCFHLASIQGDSRVGREIRAWRKRHRARGVDADPKPEEAEVLNTRRVYGWEIRELMLERKRVRLLKSECEEQREAGRQMVTPASIFEMDRAQNERDLCEPEFHTELAKLPGDSDIGAVGVDPSAETEDLSVDGARAESTNATVCSEPTEDTVKIKKNEPKANNNKKKGEPKRSGAPKVSVWFPLTFPDVPTKGDLDISRLRESQYFFS